jgi:sugar phosphate isomerase/epimerase
LGGPLGGDGVGVTSIAQLTNRTFADMATAFRQIGEVGYAGVELFDGNLLDYEDRIADFRRLLNDCSLKLVAAYSAEISSFRTSSRRSWPGLRVRRMRCRGRRPTPRGRRGRQARLRHPA